MKTITLSGLPGTHTDKQARPVHTISATLRALRDGLAASAAGDNGAFDVWVDDDGKYRCLSQRYWRTVDEQTFATIKDVRPWVKKWLKQIGTIEAVQVAGRS